MVSHQDSIISDLLDAYVFFSNNFPYKDKLAPRSFKGVLLRYHPGQKAYRVYDMMNHRVVISRDVIFHESIFPYATCSSPEDTHTSPCLPTGLDFVQDVGQPHSTSLSFQEAPRTSVEVPILSPKDHSDMGPIHSTPTTTSPLEITILSPASLHIPSFATLPHVSTQLHEISSPQDPLFAQPNPCDGHRLRHPPTWLKDFVAHTHQHGMSSSVSTNIALSSAVISAF